MLSNSTARTDRLLKIREYASAASVQRYAMLEQDAAVATIFQRVGGEWTGTVIGDDATLEMPEIGISVPLLDLYQDVDLSGTSSDDA